MAEAENTAFYGKAERCFRSLFDAARKRHELHFAFALSPEMRGAQDAGWNTAYETNYVFDEYLKFINTIQDEGMKCRVALSFYCHISEASGFYEVPKNMLRITGGECHVIWPFKDLVKKHAESGSIIAPNANKVLKDLAGHAKENGFDELSEVFRDAFDPDIRNGYAHADYVIWDDGLRLPKRNGGRARRVPWEEFGAIYDRGINFFAILRAVHHEYVSSYNPPKTIKARLAEHEPEMNWRIHCDPEAKTFTITGGMGI